MADEVDFRTLAAASARKMGEALIRAAQSIERMPL